ncbi:MAG: sel1 repeat family protein [Elusimicrobia bacterium]|nr:sel1 repeat family protein [Elusimicrobiota bacterium]
MTIGKRVLIVVLLLTALPSAARAQAAPIGEGLNCVIFMIHEQELEGAEPATYLENAKSGDADAQYKLGYAYFAQKKPKDAIAWLRRAARKGNFKAAVTVGALLVDNGPTSEREALRCWRSAADDKQVKVFALGNLGCYYGSAKYRKRDYPEALKWYRRMPPASAKLSEPFIAQLEALMKGGRAGGQLPAR